MHKFGVHFDAGRALDGVTYKVRDANFHRVGERLSLECV